MQLNLFLSERAQTHAGYERPSDLLDGPEGFLPASDPDNRVLFLHRNAVLSVSVDAAAEFGGEHMPAEVQFPEQATSAQVEILLDNGDCVTGTVRYLMPEGSRRLQDVLNQPNRFLALHDGDRARLVNKAHILRVASV
jgi:hypothetical protein